MTLNKMQSPFVTLFMFIDDTDPYVEYTAMIVREIINQRYVGIKNEKGVYITPAFPKLIYVLDKNTMPGGKYHYITEEAIRCTAKRLYPDYISAKKMRENYNGEVFSCMGCVYGKSVIRYKYKGIEYKGTFEHMWKSLVKEHAAKPQEIINGVDSPHLYMEVPDLYIYDSKEGYVKVKKVIKNKDVTDWLKVRISNNTNIYCTYDHPFPVLHKGRTLAFELKVGDKLLYNNNEDTTRESDLIEVTVENVADINGIQMDSYDVETESDHFEVDGIYSHNCRSFLSPWKDENGNYKWEGRFNLGRHRCPAI